jgi:hypothetical protein
VSWEKGREVIEDLLEEGRHLLAKARTHLATATATAEADPEIAYDALYAAARKALTALLVEQGLRPTREGGSARQHCCSEPWALSGH